MLSFYEIDQLGSRAVAGIGNRTAGPARLYTGSSAVLPWEGTGGVLVCLSPHENVGS